MYFYDTKVWCIAPHFYTPLLQYTTAVLQLLGLCCTDMEKVKKVLQAAIVKPEIFAKKHVN